MPQEVFMGTLKNDCFEMSRKLFQKISANSEPVVPKSF